MSAEETAPHLTTRAVCRRDAALLRKELDISAPVSRRFGAHAWLPTAMIADSHARQIHPGPCGRQIL